MIHSRTLLAIALIALALLLASMACATFRSPDEPLPTAVPTLTTTPSPAVSPTASPTHTLTPTPTFTSPEVTATGR